MPVETVQGIDLYFEDTGGAGPAVVFSHGIYMDADMFAPQVEALREEFRCISWDQRAHGRTGGDTPFTYWDSAGDLLGLLDRLGVDNAFLVGMSQGGFVSLRAALLTPERVTGIVFIDSQAGPEPEQFLPVYQSMLDEWVAGGPNDVLLEGTARIILGDEVEWGPWTEKWSRMPSGAIVAAFGALTGREDLHDRLAEVTCPALVIHGELDAAISMELAQRLCAGLPECEGIVTVTGAGHSSNLHSPGVVAEAVRDFVRHHTS